MIALTALIGIIGLNALAFGKDSLFLYSLMAPVNITFGLFFAGEALERYQWIAGVAIAILGTYCLIKAATLGLDEYRARRNG